MSDPEVLMRTERVKIKVRYTCTTNNINDPNYFDDYYEEKWVNRKRRNNER